MERKDPILHPIYQDREVGTRYNRVVEAGRKYFQRTALTDSKKDITESDLERINYFFADVSPVNPTSLWRPQRPDLSRERGEIADGSFFGNWEDPGGPLESFRLASEAAPIIQQELLTNLRHQESDYTAIAMRQAELGSLDPNLLRAAGLLHDIGRTITHTFYTNDVVAHRLLQRIGIRSDISSILPKEEVMLAPEGQMQNVIDRMPVGGVIIRIADEFGKRYPGSNRVYQPEDYDMWDRQSWANGYTSRPESGRPSDANMRRNMQRHVDNVPPYFQSLDNWVQGVSTLTLKDVTSALGNQLGSTLAPLPEK